MKVAKFDILHCAGLALVMVLCACATHRTDLSEFALLRDKYFATKETKRLTVREADIDLLTRQITTAGYIATQFGDGVGVSETLFKRGDSAVKVVWNRKLHNAVITLAVE